MSNCTPSLAEIVIGSAFEFDLYLEDEEGRPVSLSSYASGKLVFANAAGTRTEFTLTLPGANPDKGHIKVTGVATGADKKWASADLELVNLTAQPVIVPLTNMFSIIAKNTPPAA